MLGSSPRTGLLLLGALLAALPGCEDADVFIPLPDQSGPAGVLDGTVTYSGPRPCTKDGRVVGAAIVLGFDTRLLPPPEGLGTSAASLDVIPGDELFGGLGAALDLTNDGALRCPAPDDPPVTVSATWRLSPLPAGTYQVRGFYDHDGDFDPIFSIANLPTRGDVAGGAIENAAEVLGGAAPRYREIALAAPIPATGARVSGIAVTLGLPLPLERPIFHVAEVLAPPAGVEEGPGEVVMASDFQLETFSPGDPAGTEASLLRLRLAAGVPDEEIASAAKPPISLPVGGEPAPTLTYARQDVNGDGAIDGDDHVPDSALLPALFPVAVFAKQSADDPLVSQAAPAVLLQGLTIYDDLLTTATLGAEPLDEPRDSALVGVRPAALCMRPTEPERGGVLVISHAKDKEGNDIIAEQDMPEVEEALARQFGRPIEIVYGCLPEGRYALNLIYGTGQAWTVPNEAGVCAPSEAAPSPDVCGARPRLASQDMVLRIGPPDDPAYCAEHPTPALCLP
ncbi:hypothetical protein BE04_42345 [Sorangium cellulosum]|uniref:EF-hand domain-containing protein n=1 Tax=Sorangium cellulosum TaxID=56 RepID=A0A150PX17_SORCE|nr:hypothetical protein BE04_42345 [Sorangium cellulosum]